MIHATAAESVMRSASVHEFQKGDGRAEGGIYLVCWRGPSKPSTSRDLPQDPAPPKVLRGSRLHDVDRIDSVERLRESRVG